MIRNRPFKQVDVFTAKPFLGNPVAVVLDAQGLDSAQMQAIARWTKLSETTFVLPPDDPQAHYRLRIFTPSAELPFAGHPTLGSAHAILESGIVSPDDGILRQQCDAGLIEIRIDSADGLLWLRAPEPHITPLPAEHRQMLEGALGSQLEDRPMRIDVGPVWVTARVRSVDEVLAIDADMTALSRLSEMLAATGVTVFATNGDGEQACEVRSFAPLHGIDEDPVCGSGNICVASYRASHAQTCDYVARQGRAIGRDGYIRVRHRDGNIQVGGNAVTCINGTLLA